MLENSKIAKKIQNGKALRKKKRDDQLLIFKTLSSELKFKRKKNQNKKKIKTKTDCIDLWIESMAPKSQSEREKEPKNFFFLNAYDGLDQCNEWIKRFHQTKVKFLQPKMIIMTVVGMMIHQKW